MPNDTPPAVPPLPGQAAPPASPRSAAVSCLLCGTAYDARRADCPRCGAPPGMVADPDDPTASTYIPAARR